MTMTNLLDSISLCEHLRREVSAIKTTKMHPNSGGSECACCFHALKDSDELYYCLRCESFYCMEHFKSHTVRRVNHECFFAFCKSVGERTMNSGSIICGICEIRTSDQHDHVPKLEIAEAVTFPPVFDHSEIENVYEEIPKYDCMHQETLSCEVLTGGVLKKQCNICNACHNLWLCLSCGYVACGRGETGGRGHALGHNAGSEHPISVKLGTITPQGMADVWCYKCQACIYDFHLKEHLEFYGLQLSTQEKTEPTLRELEVKCEGETLNQTTEASNPSWNREDELWKGFDHIGIQNTGNSCYMASVFHLLCASTSFADWYTDSEYTRSHSQTPHAMPERECSTCQMIKLVSGLNDKSRLQKSRSFCASLPLAADLFQKHALFYLASAGCGRIHDLFAQ